MRLSTLCLAAFFIFRSHAFSQPVKTYLPDQLKRDFTIFRNALEQAHPGIYWYRSKTEIDKAFDQAWRALDHPLTELEFFRTIAPVVSAVGCGHTWIATTDATQRVIWDNGKVLPLKIKFSEGRAFCVQNNSEDPSAIKTGDEVLSINGLTIDSLLRLSNHFSPGDGFIETGRMKILDNVFNQFYTLYIAQPETYEIVINGPDGVTRTVTIKGQPLPHVEKISKERYPSGTFGTSNIHLSFLAGTSASLMRIKEFSDAKNFDFTKTLHTSFQRIDSARSKTLIIDLRDNDGGNERYGLLLYSYLTNKPFIGYLQIDFRTTRFDFRHLTTTSWLQYKTFKLLLRHRKLNDTTYLLTNSKATRIHLPQPKTFQGKVYVLINRGSFSTTSDFTSLAQSNGIAEFVGEETGGSYFGNSSNFNFLLTLPNTRIKINLPVARYQTNVAPGHAPGRGTIPEHPIVYGGNDILTGKDKELEFVLSRVR